MNARAQGPLGGARDARAARAGEEEVNLQRQRVLELGGDRSPARATIARAAARSRRCRWPISSACARLRGAPRRQVRLERHLDHDRAAGAGHLRQQRRRVGDVLEHVREDTEVVLAVGGRQVGAVEQLHAVDLRALAGDVDRGRRQLEAREGAPEAPPAELAEQRAVAAADVERSIASVSDTRARCTARSRGRPCRPRRGPASGSTELGLRGLARVGVARRSGRGWRGPPRRGLSLPR